jgi:serine protease Do
MIDSLRLKRCFGCPVWAWAGILTMVLAWGSLPVQPDLAPVLAQDELAQTITDNPGTDFSDEQWQKIIALENHRIATIDSVAGSVVAIYGESREGGGSGVIIDPSGIALTNHHVIMGAGVSGWGGLADGKLYRWNLVGTDPGGDVSIIQLEGQDHFPFSPLGDSDLVQPGDWALAMGNPFVLTEDQYPTVTLGIVSGVQRYQPGESGTLLVYGNCIQVDSSINPGNSGGPLFNMRGEVIGINGRGSFSFRDRGKVNVGLGYAISANQIKNFIPELLATKLIQHGTLDASFSDRGGKVVCSTINRDAPVAAAGLDLGDELLEFEGHPIRNANQFTNLICTLPVGWPAELKLRRSDGTQYQINTRLLGLPYPQPPPATNNRPSPQPQQPESDQPIQEQAMRKLLSATPNTVRHSGMNQHYTAVVLSESQRMDSDLPSSDELKILSLEDQILRATDVIGQQTIWVANDGRFYIHWRAQQDTAYYWFDGRQAYHSQDQEQWRPLTLAEIKLTPPLIQGIVISEPLRASRFPATPYRLWGNPMIDAGDKSQAQPAFRIIYLDQDQDPFYAWFSLGKWNGQSVFRILKTAASPDSSDNSGVTYSQWTSIELPTTSRVAASVELPLVRTWVQGLPETPQLSVVNQSYQWLDKSQHADFIPKNIGSEKVKGDGQ